MNMRHELQYKTMPKKADIANRLERLAEEMADLGICMDYYGGLSEWAKHGAEMIAAAKTATEWAEEIRKECND